ncbi:MAG TPA: ankyrin repeat domain-containing protein [Candidatus Dependentiae bacterium]|nr:ankyrin repeat domain-containing protein [Candidatus Dependentiae bacterium]HRQ62415.1 ankyrin repeat domain-containing protein [Candidatus Dependentiae bacterium]
MFLQLIFFLVPMVCVQDMCYGMKRSHEQAFQPSIISCHETSAQLSIFETTGLLEDMWEEIIDHAFTPIKILPLSGLVGYYVFNYKDEALGGIKLITTLRATNKYLKQFLSPARIVLMLKKYNLKQQVLDTYVGYFLGIHTFDCFLKINFPINFFWTRIFFQAGANPSRQIFSGKSLLHLIIMNRRLDVANLLLQAEADIQAEDINGDSPLHYAVNARCPMSIQLLVQFGADVNAKNYNKQTPLHLAIERCCLNTINALLQVGADIEAKNNREETPLHVAVSTSNLYVQIPYRLEAIQTLLRAGADIEARDFHQGTPLHGAARWGRPAVLQELLDAGAEVNARDMYGNTPLHWAVDWGVPKKIVRLLLQAGADVHAKDNDGRTPLDLAEKKKGRLEIAQLIREYKKD